jgi:hypothetical protein
MESSSIGGVAKESSAIGGAADKENLAGVEVGLVVGDAFPRFPRPNRRFLRFSLSIMVPSACANSSIVTLYS